MALSTLATGGTWAMRGKRQTEGTGALAPERPGALAALATRVKVGQSSQAPRAVEAVAVEVEVEPLAA